LTQIGVSNFGAIAIAFWLILIFVFYLTKTTFISAEKIMFSSLCVYLLAR